MNQLGAQIGQLVDEMSLSSQPRDLSGQLLWPALMDRFGVQLGQLMAVVAKLSQTRALTG